LNTNVNANTSLGPGEFAYGNKADKVAFFPNETNTQYSSYSGYDASLDNHSHNNSNHNHNHKSQQQQQ
jgi:hypothetical protein